MSQHGIDPDGGVTDHDSVNAANYGDMQKQILEALAKHGVPTGFEPPAGIDNPPQPPEVSSGS